MTISRYTDIIERLERAEGPDREMDAEIMFDLFAKPVGKKDDGGPSGYLWPEDNPSWSFGIRFPGKGREWFTRARAKVDGETLLIERDGALVLMNALRAPKLTASLDAAVALVERMLPDHDWSLFADNGEAIAGVMPASEDGCDEAISHGATPAIALLIALFRAMEAQESGE